MQSSVYLHQRTVPLRSAVSIAVDALFNT
jgi:hypothetical protein